MTTTSFFRTQIRFYFKCWLSTFKASTKSAKILVIDSSVQSGRLKFKQTRVMWTAELLLTSFLFTSFWITQWFFFKICTHFNLSLIKPFRWRWWTSEILPIHLSIRHKKGLSNYKTSEIYFWYLRCFFSLASCNYRRNDQQRSLRKRKIRKIILLLPPLGFAKIKNLFFSLTNSEK